VFSGVVVGTLIALSVYVWRRVREPLGYFTTWAIEALLWGVVLGVLTGVSAVLDDSTDIPREVLLGAGSGVLVVAGWAVLIIPGRGLVKGLVSIRRRSRTRRGVTGTRTASKAGSKARHGSPAKKNAAARQISSNKADRPAAKARKSGRGAGTRRG
jgi:hypothetical protein